jgi:hypothetical protein
MSTDGIVSVNYSLLGFIAIKLSGNNADNIYLKLDGSNSNSDITLDGYGIIANFGTFGNIVIPDVFDAMHEPTGFPNITDSTISFDDMTRTLTITPSGESFYFYEKGVKYTKNDSDSIQITDVEGLHYIYFSSGVLTEVVNPDFSSSGELFKLYPTVSVVYWDNENSKHIYLSEERHGLLMDGATHSYQHIFEGTRYRSGLALYDISSDASGNNDSSAQISVSAGIIQDEDLIININDDVPQNLSLPANIPIYYKVGAGLWRRDNANNFPVKSFVGGSNRLAWNQFTGGSWQQTEVTNTDFVLAHIFATNDIDNPIIAVQGQADYVGNPITGLANAREGALIEINNLITSGLPFIEFKPIGTLIYETDNGYTNTVKARIRRTDTGDDYVDFRFSTGTSVNIIQGASAHNNLSGLQGGQAGEYYHNTSSGLLLTSPGSDGGFHGIYEKGIYGENLIAGDLVYLKSDGKYWKALADSESTLPCIGLATISGNAESNNNILKTGYYRDDSWSWTIGGLLYLDITTGGELTQTIPSGSGKFVQIVGYAISSTVIYFKPDFTYLELA